jgi:hypothetical protein
MDGLTEGEPLLVELFDKDFNSKEFLGQVRDPWQSPQSLQHLAVMLTSTRDFLQQTCRQAASLSARLLSSSR